MQKDKQYILCSAIHFDDGKEYVHQPKNIKSGFVLCGRRHHNIFAQLLALGVEEKDYTPPQCHVKQGFLTNDDLFVTRKEAYYIAVNSGQLLTPETPDNPTIQSEDLW